MSTLARLFHDVANVAHASPIPDVPIRKALFSDEPEPQCCWQVSRGPHGRRGMRRKILREKCRERALATLGTSSFASRTASPTGAIADSTSTTCRGNGRKFAVTTSSTKTSFGSTSVSEAEGGDVTALTPEESEKLEAARQKEIEETRIEKEKLDHLTVRPLYVRCTMSRSKPDLNGTELDWVDDKCRPAMQLTEQAEDGSPAPWWFNATALPRAFIEKMYDAGQVGAHAEAASSTGNGSGSKGGEIRWTDAQLDLLKKYDPSQYTKRGMLKEVAVKEEEGPENTDAATEANAAGEGEGDDTKDEDGNAGAKEEDAPAESKKGKTVEKTAYIEKEGKTKKAGESSEREKEEDEDEFADLEKKIKSMKVPDEDTQWESFPGYEAEALHKLATALKKQQRACKNHYLSSGKQIGSVVEIHSAYDFANLPKRCIQGAPKGGSAREGLHGEYRLEFYKSRRDALPVTPEEQHIEDCRSSCGFQDNSCANVFRVSPFTRDRVRVHSEKHDIIGRGDGKGGTEVVQTGSEDAASASGEEKAESAESSEPPKNAVSVNKDGMPTRATLTQMQGYVCRDYTRLRESRKTVEPWTVEGKELANLTDEDLWRQAEDDATEYYQHVLAHKHEVASGQVTKERTAHLEINKNSRRSSTQLVPSISETPQEGMIYEAKKPADARATLFTDASPAASVRVEGEDGGDAIRGENGEGLRTSESPEADEGGSAGSDDPKGAEGREEAAKTEEENSSGGADARGPEVHKPQLKVEERTHGVMVLQENEDANPAKAEEDAGNTGDAASANAKEDGAASSAVRSKNGKKANKGNKRSIGTSALEIARDRNLRQKNKSPHRHTASFAEAVESALSSAGEHALDAVEAGENATAQAAQSSGEALSNAAEEADRVGGMVAESGGNAADNLAADAGDGFAAASDAGGVAARRASEAAAAAGNAAADYGSAAGAEASMQAHAASERAGEAAAAGAARVQAATDAAMLEARSFQADVTRSLNANALGKPIYLSVLTHDLNPSLLQKQNGALDATMKEVWTKAYKRTYGHMPESDSLSVKATLQDLMNKISDMSKQGLAGGRAQTCRLIARMAGLETQNNEQSPLVPAPNPNEAVRKMIEALQIDKTEQEHSLRLFGYEGQWEMKKAVHDFMHLDKEEDPLHNCTPRFRMEVQDPSFQRWKELNERTRQLRVEEMERLQRENGEAETVDTGRSTTVPGGNRLGVLISNSGLASAEQRFNNKNAGLRTLRITVLPAKTGGMLPAECPYEGEMHKELTRILGFDSEKEANRVTMPPEGNAMDLEGNRTLVTYEVKEAPLKAAPPQAPQQPDECAGLAQRMCNQEQPTKPKPPPHIDEIFRGPNAAETLARELVQETGLTAGSELRELASGVVNAAANAAGTLKGTAKTQVGAVKDAVTDRSPFMHRLQQYLKTSTKGGSAAKATYRAADGSLVRISGDDVELFDADAAPDANHLDPDCFQHVRTFVNKRHYESRAWVELRVPWRESFQDRSGKLLKTGDEVEFVNPRTGAVEPTLFGKIASGPVSAEEYSSSRAGGARNLEVKEADGDQSSAEATAEENKNQAEARLGLSKLPVSATGASAEARDARSVQFENYVRVWLDEYKPNRNLPGGAEKVRHPEPVIVPMSWIARRHSESVREHDVARIDLTAMLQGPKKSDASDVAHEAAGAFRERGAQAVEVEDIMSSFVDSHGAGEDIIEKIPNAPATDTEAEGGTLGKDNEEVRTAENSQDRGTEALQGQYVEVLDSYGSVDNPMVHVRLLKPLRLKSRGDFDLASLVGQARKNYFMLHRDFLIRERARLPRAGLNSMELLSRSSHLADLSPPTPECSTFFKAAGEINPEKSGACTVDNPSVLVGKHCATSTCNREDIRFCCGTPARAAEVMDSNTCGVVFKGFEAVKEAIAEFTDESVAREGDGKRSCPADKPAVLAGRRCFVKGEGSAMDTRECRIDATDTARCCGLRAEAEAHKLAPCSTFFAKGGEGFCGASNQKTRLLPNRVCDGPTCLQERDAERCCGTSAEFAATRQKCGEHFKDYTLSVSTAGSRNDREALINEKPKEQIEQDGGNTAQDGREQCPASLMYVQSRQRCKDTLCTAESDEKTCCAATPEPHQACEKFFQLYQDFAKYINEDPSKEIGFQGSTTTRGHCTLAKPFIIHGRECAGESCEQNADVDTCCGSAAEASMISTEKCEAAFSRYAHVENGEDGNSELQLQDTQKFTCTKEKPEVLGWRHCYNSMCAHDDEPTCCGTKAQSEAPLEKCEHFFRPRFEDKVENGSLTPCPTDGSPAPIPGRDCAAPECDATEDAETCCGTPAEAAAAVSAPKAKCSEFFQSRDQTAGSASETKDADDTAKQSFACPAEKPTLLTGRHCSGSECDEKKDATSCCGTEEESALLKNAGGGQECSEAFTDYEDKEVASETNVAHAAASDTEHETSSAPDKKSLNQCPAEDPIVKVGERCANAHCDPTQDRGVCCGRAGPKPSELESAGEQNVAAPKDNTPLVWSDGTRWLQGLRIEFSTDFAKKSREHYSGASTHTDTSAAAEAQANKQITPPNAVPATTKNIFDTTPGPTAQLEIAKATLTRQTPASGRSSFTTEDDAAAPTGIKATAPDSRTPTPKYYAEGTHKAPWIVGGLDITGLRARLGRFFPDTGEYEIYLEDPVPIPRKYLRKSALQAGSAVRVLEKTCSSSGRNSLTSPGLTASLGLFHAGGFPRVGLVKTHDVTASAADPERHAGEVDGYFDVTTSAGPKRVPAQMVVESEADCACPTPDLVSESNTIVSRVCVAPVTISEEEKARQFNREKLAFLKTEAERYSKCNFDSLAVRQQLAKRLQGTLAEGLGEELSLAPDDKSVEILFHGYDAAWWSRLEMEMQRAAAAANLSIADENNTFVKQAKALVEQLAAKGISPRELQRRGYPAAVVGSETENDYLLRHPSHAAQCRAAHFRGPEGKTSLAGEDEVSRERRWFRDVVRQKFDKNSRVVDPSFLYNAAVRRLLFEHFLRLGRPLPPDDSLARRLRSFAEDTSATLKGEADTRFTKLLDSIKRRLFVGSLAFDAYTGTGIPRLAKAGFGVARGMKTGQVAAAKAGEGLAAAAKTGAELAENAGERIVQGSGAARALLQEGLRYPLSHVRKMHAGYTWPLFAHDEFAYRVGETGAEGTHSTSFGEPVEDVPLGYFYLRRRHADFLENVTQRLKRSTDPEDTHIQEELRTKEQLEESERADADWWEKHEKEMAPENKAAAVADNATAQGTGDEGEEGEATGRGSASRAIQVEVESEEDGPAWTRWFFNMITQADYRAAVQETAKEVGFACADSTSRNGLIESALQSMSVDTAGEEVAGGFPKVCRPEVGQCEALTDPRACEESKVCESVFNSFRPVGVPEAVRLSEETHCRTYDFLFKSTKGKGFPEKEQVQTLLESNVGNRKSDADANINVAQEQEDEKDAASDEHERDKASTTNDIVSPDGKCEFKLFQCRTKRALSRREQWNRARTREFDSFGCGKYSQSKSDCAQHKPFCVYEMPRYCRKRSTAVNYVREKRGEGSVCRLAVPGSAGNVKVGCGAEAEFLARESGEIGAAGKGQQAPAASAAVKNCETASEGYVVRAPSEDPDYADRVVRELAVVPKSVEKVVEEKVLPHVREAFRDLIDAEVDSEETRVSAETRTLGKADEMPADNIEADVEAREKEATEAAGARGGGRSSVGEKAVLKPGEAQIRGLARYLRAQGPEAAAAAKRVTGIDRRMRAASRVQALLRFFSVDLEHEFARGTTNRIGPRPRMGITTRVGNYSEGHESHVDSQRWDQAYQSEMRGFKAMLDEATGSEFLDRLMGTLEAFRHIRPGSAAAATGNSLQPPSTLTPTGGTADGNSSQSTFDSMMYGLNLMRQNIAWFTVHKMGAPPVFTVGSEMAEKTVSTALHTAQTLVSKAMSSAACTFLDSDALLSQFHEMGHALLDDLSNFWMNMSGIAFVYSLQTAADEADGAGEEHTTWMRDSSTSDVVRDTRELPSFDNPFSSKRDFASVWNGARTDYCSEVPVSHCHEVEPCVVVRRRFRRRPKGYSERFRGYFGLSKESKGLQRDVREFQVCMSREFANTEVLEQDQVSQNLGDRFLGVSKTGGKQPDWSFDWNFQKPTNPTLIIPEVIKNRKLLGGSSLSKATSAEGGGLFRDTTSKYKSGKLLEE